MSRRKTTVMKEDTLPNKEEEIAESPASDTLVTHPGSKTEAIARIVDWLGSLKPEDALNCYDLMVKQVGHEAKQDFSGQNKASVAMKGAVKEDILAIFGSEELSEEFKDKVTTLFEAALSARFSVAFAELREELETINEEKINTLVENLVAKLDEYITYVAEAWVEKNEVAVETSLRTEITNDFVKDMVEVFNKHNINLPEEKVDVVEELIALNDEATEKLNEALNENANLTASLKHYRREELFAEACEGLSVLDIEKLHSLQEDITFNEETYAKKLETIKEGFLVKSKVGSEIGLANEEGIDNLDEVIEEKPVSTGDSVMDSFVSAISRMASKK
jgi:hypothetical protein